ncbi:hypothetical protein OPQ81_000397 [Rhizoctonia solani]|nr:hypothetical protein OPQ81_000397 [Rhizoctonia solani]
MATASIHSPIMVNSLEAKGGNSFPPFSRSKFFFEDSMIHIQIENVDFKLHKSKLIKSETFLDMFTVAESSNTDGKAMEGSSIEHPIKLEGVSASDFECLLTFLYEGDHPINEHPKIDLRVVPPAFRLAHMWNFKQLREYLLPHLEESLDAVDRIVYAREFGIKEWVTPACIELYRRTQPLNSQEAEKLGFKTAMLIFRLRDERYTTTYQQCCGQPPKLESVNVKIRVRCDSCGYTRDVNGCATDKAIEERIKVWEKNGQVFEK